MVLADVETVRERYGDHRLQDTVARQLVAADLLVLNKCDRVPREAIGEVESWARERTRAPTIRSIGADVPVELLAVPGPAVTAPPVTGEGDEDTPASSSSSTESVPDAGDRVSPGQVRDHRPGSREHRRTPAEPKSLRQVDSPRPAAHRHAADHTRRFVSRFVSCPDPMDPVRLRAALSSLMPRVLRAKGFVVSPGGPGPEWLVVQASGRTVDIEPRPASPERGAPAPGVAPGVTPGIMFIGVEDLPDPETLARAVRHATARATPS